MLGPIAAWICLSAAAAGPPIAVHVEQSDGLTTEETRRLGAALAEELSAFLTDEPELECSSRSCLDGLRARVGASEVVLVRFLAAADRLRVVATKMEPPDLIAQRVQVDLIRGAEQKAMAPIAALLGAAKPPTEAPPPPPAHIAESNAGWALALSVLGLGLAAGGTAIGLRVASNAARDEVASTSLSPDALAATKDRSNAFGVSSNILFGAALALITGGSVYLLLGSTNPSTACPAGTPAITN
ncbi:MAG: hypothetical protein U1E65_32120 [Myxococcota bacterium]